MTNNKEDLIKKERRIQDLESKVAAMEQNIEAKDKEIAEKKIIIDERGRGIKVLESILRERERCNESMWREIVETRGTVSKMEKLITDLDSKVKEREKVVECFKDALLHLTLLATKGITASEEPKNGKFLKESTGKVCAICGQPFELGADLDTLSAPDGTLRFVHKRCKERLK